MKRNTDCFRCIIFLSFICKNSNLVKNNSTFAHALGKSIILFQNLNQKILNLYYSTIKC